MKKTMLLFMLIACTVPVTTTQAMNAERGNHESCLELDLLECRGQRPETVCVEMPTRSIPLYFVSRAKLTRTAVDELKEQFPDFRKISLIYPNGCEKIILNRLAIVLTKLP